MNNITYYELFNSAINRHLIEKGSLDIKSGEIAAIVPEMRCKYRKPVRFPGRLDVGLKVTRLGNSSVVVRKEDDDASEECYFVHVFVSRRKQGQTVRIPTTVRTALTKLSDRKT